MLPLAAASSFASIWYAAPLVVSVTLVCAATRQEEMPAILSHAGRFSLWILGFMAVFMGLLLFLERLS